MDKVKEINELSQKIRSADSGFSFLIFLDKYIETID